MQKKDNVSMSVIRRLPRYYRFLSELRKTGKTRTSSIELSEKMGFTASQIRQDFNCFGGFGQQGYGYNIEQLLIEIENILGLGKNNKCILIGAGNLGKAIAGHTKYGDIGLELIGIFDNNKELCGQTVQGHEIMDFSTVGEFVKKNKPDLAILCVPRDAADEITETLYSHGIKAYWNFSHYDITNNRPDVIVENVHLNDSMMTLCYRINIKKQK